MNDSLDLRKLLDTYPANSFEEICVSSLSDYPLDQISPIVLNLCVCAKEGVIIDVPISLGLRNEPDENNKTVMNPAWWIKLFLRYDYIIDIDRSKVSGRRANLVFRKERLTEQKV
jgi:hypothetical protein